MYNIKTQLLNLHSFGPDELYRQSGIPALYEKLVTGRFARIEVQFVGTPEDEAMLVERFRIMWPEGNASDLEKIMSLKGVGNKSRQTIPESFDTSGALGSVANMGSAFKKELQAPLLRCQVRWARSARSSRKEVRKDDNFLS